jgi:hypothetical protein
MYHEEDRSKQTPPNVQALKVALSPKPLASPSKVTFDSSLLHNALEAELAHHRSPARPDSEIANETVWVDDVLWVTAKEVQFLFFYIVFPANVADVVVFQVTWRDSHSETHTTSFEPI